MENLTELIINKIEDNPLVQYHYIADKLDGRFYYSGSCTDIKLAWILHSYINYGESYSFKFIHTLSTIKN